jgi:hypothetical protein
VLAQGGEIEAERLGVHPAHPHPGRPGVGEQRAQIPRGAVGVISLSIEDGENSVIC